MRKRQQIGRSPVAAHNGERRALSVEEDYLTVIANEAFETFAASLQREIEEEDGHRVPWRIVDDRKRPC